MYVVKYYVMALVVKIYVFTKFILAIYLWTLTSSIYAASDSPASMGQDVKNPQMGRYSISRSYNQILSEKKRSYEPEGTFKAVASGVAAIFVGSYGFYNDNSSILASFTYTGIQSLGIVLTTNAVYEANISDPFLHLDRKFRKNGQITYTQYKASMTRINEDRAYKSLMRDTALTGLLATSYAYDGLRSYNQSKAVRDVYTFLTINFTLAFLANSYKLLTWRKSPQLVADSVSIDVFPLPKLTYNF